MENVKKKKPLYIIAECAVLVALALAISFVKIEIGAFGGSVDFVMIPLFIICYRNGAGYGVLSGLVLGFLKCLVGGGIGWGLPSVLLDYVLAYGACGVAGLIISKEISGKKAFVEIGTFLGCFARFIIHFISGVTIYKIVEPTAVEGISHIFINPVTYSIVYNLIYMLPNTVIAVVVMALLRYPIKKLERI
ncbi:MAG: energy-coupled thiamine transporter ThiT [Clostridia bacterium]|nr:energy-coupled thiamine transporter ThiT [Clostridia bacterium]